MKKFFLTLFLLCSLTISGFAQERARVFPEQSLMTFKGLDDTSSPPIVLDGRAADIQNITLDITGQASKRYGTSFEVLLDTNDVVDNFEAVNGLWELYKSDGTRTRLAVCGSKLFSWSLGTKTNITGGVTLTEGQDYQVNWATALDYAIGTNGYNPPFKTNGTSSSALSFGALSSPPTKAKCVIWWKNYLILGNTYEGTTTHSTRIRWSNVGYIETWSDDDYVDIAALGGQQIEGFGTLYDNLFIFLTDSIYKVSLVGGDELITVTKVSEGIGCIAKNSIQNIQIGNSEGLIFLSRDKTINYCDGIKVQEISTLISEVMDDLSASRLPYAISVDDQTNAHYYLAVTTGTATNNNLLLDFHYGIGEWSKHTQIDANAFCWAIDANTIPQVYFGNYKSFLYQLNNVDKKSDVAGETGTFDYIGAYAPDKRDTTTASGLIVLYDASANFSDVTGAIVRITSGTGVDTEDIIAATTATGIVVSNASFTATGQSVYSIGDIDAYYTTKWYDMGSAPLRKNFLDLYVWSSTATSATMQAYYATDFSSTISSIDLVSTTSGSLWGTAIWGTDTWAGTSTSLTILPLSVSGRFMKIKFSEPTIDEPMDLMGYSFLLQDLEFK